MRNIIWAFIEYFNNPFLYVGGEWLGVEVVIKEGRNLKPLNLKSMKYLCILIYVDTLKCIVLGCLCLLFEYYVITLECIFIKSNMIWYWIHVCILLLSVCCLYCLILLIYSWKHLLCIYSLFITQWKFVTRIIVSLT